MYELTYVSGHSFVFLINGPDRKRQHCFDGIEIVIIWWECMLQSCEQEACVNNCLRCKDALIVWRTAAFGGNQVICCTLSSIVVYDAFLMCMYIFAWCVVSFWIFVLKKSRFEWFLFLCDSRMWHIWWSMCALTGMQAKRISLPYGFRWYSKPYEWGLEQNWPAGWPCGGPN